MEILKALIEMIYPPRCIICDDPILEDGFCKRCENKLKVNSVETCFNCGIDKKHCECTKFLYHQPKECFRIYIF